MLNTALQELSKDGTIADNTYQLIGEDGVLPQGDVVLTVEQLDQIANITGKKALYLTVDASPETNEFPLEQLDAIFIEFAGFNDGRVIHLLHCFAVKVSRVSCVRLVMCSKMS